MANDIAIGASNLLPVGPPKITKPPYLITLEKHNGKTLLVEKFLSLDKPQSENGFIQVKGFYLDKTEEEIAKNYTDILNELPKELTLEMMFPLHRIISVRNLVFNAVKNTTHK
jgi:hypothetical protein